MCHLVDHAEVCPFLQSSLLSVKFSILKSLEGKGSPPSPSAREGSGEHTHYRPGNKKVPNKDTMLTFGRTLRKLG